MTQLQTSFAFTILLMVSSTTIYATNANIKSDVPESVQAKEINLQELIIAEDYELDKNHSFKESRKSIKRYRNIIEELQKDKGVYNARIGELLIQLGLSYKNIGRYDDAMKAFKGSLQNTRINQGLYTPNQIPIIELMIESGIAMGDSEALDDNYNLMYWVIRRNYEENDLELIPILNRLSDLYLKAYQLGSGGKRFLHLFKAKKVYRQLISIYVANYGRDDPKLIKVIHEFAIMNFQIAVYAHNIFDSAGGYFGPQYYGFGEQAMLRIHEIYDKNPDLPVEAHARSIVELGDWYLLFRKQMAAIDTYSNAYALLNKYGTNQEIINQIFGRPIKLPASTLPPQSQDKVKGDSDTLPYALASFDVSKYGSPKNIQILELKPEDDMMLLHQTKKTIRAIRYRPRFENGQPVSTSNINMRYISNN